MHIERNHDLGKEDAVHKIDSFLDDLMSRQVPGGITIEEPSKSWSDNVMRFSFKAKKGFFGTTISGMIRVNDDSVIIDSDLQDSSQRFFPKTKSDNKSTTNWNAYSG